MYMVHAITNLLACEMKLHAHSSVIPNINISILTFSLFEKLNSAFVFYIWFDIINLQRGFTVIRYGRMRSIFLQDCIPRSIQYWHCNLTVLDISSSSWNIREQKTKRTFDCNLKNFEVQNLNSSSLKLTDRKTNIAPNVDANNRSAWSRTIHFCYFNAHAKVKKLISDVQFPGNRFELGIIENNFWSFTIWIIQIQVSFPGFENTKNSGIQNMDYWMFYKR